MALVSILISTLLCIALQRFANLASWFNPKPYTLYLHYLGPWLNKINEVVALLLIVVPSLLLLAGLHYLILQQFGILVELLFCTLILLFSLDARDLKLQLEPYFNSLEKNDLPAAATAGKEFITAPVPTTLGELSRTVTTTILVRSFIHLFAGLFWFMVLGIYGISCYTIIRMLKESTLKNEPYYRGVIIVATQVYNILNWLPAKLVTISYALAGNFNKGFNYWLTHLLTPTAELPNFIIGAGLASLTEPSALKQGTAKENYEALDLINRVLIIWVVILALLLLGSFTITF